MISSSEANEATKFFTHHWTITLPTHPPLRYLHTTVSHLDPWFALYSDPANHPYDENARSTIWDEAAISEWMKTTSQKYIDSQSQFGALQMLVEWDGEIVGGCNFFLLPTYVVNLGMMLGEKARGKGIGKLSMQVMIQLGRRVGIEKMEARTVKANKPMQAVMASLKIPGRDEIKEMPGRGVVGDIVYEIPQKVSWEDFDMRVEFGGLASEPLC